MIIGMYMFILFNPDTYIALRPRLENLAGFAQGAPRGHSP